MPTAPGRSAADTSPSSPRPSGRRLQEAGGVIHTLALITIIGRIGLACVLATAVGLERELEAQPAGLRTHVLVALGATLFTAAGVEVNGSDPTRIAAQVVTGIGFLGGGAILREGANVRGLTTAATLWLTAAIGVSCGLGRYSGATFTALFAVIVIVTLKRIERRLFHRRRAGLVAIDVKADVDSAVRRLHDHLPGAKVVSVQTVSPGVQRVSLRARLPGRSKMPALADRLLAEPGICGVSIGR